MDTTCRKWRYSNILAGNAGVASATGVRVRRTLSVRSNLRVNKCVALCLAVGLWTASQARAQQGPTARHEPVLEADTSSRLLDTGFKKLYELDFDGKTVARWCFAPKGNLAIGDVLLAQKIALETMEGQALAIANRQACCH